METIGSLVDKLSIANIRLWHLEDKRRDLSLSDKDRLEAADMVSVVNKERNGLIDEIDVLLNDCIVTNKVKISLKNKMYND
jgi:hypothetical protein